MVCAKWNFENHKSAIDVNTCVDIIHIAEVFGMPQVSLLKTSDRSNKIGSTKILCRPGSLMLVTDVEDEMCWLLL